MARWAAGMAGWKGWVAPLIATVAERSGRSWRMTLPIARPVRFWTSRATARAVNTTGRWASMAARGGGDQSGEGAPGGAGGGGEPRPGPQIGLAHPEVWLDPPQVVVAADDLGRG